MANLSVATEQLLGNYQVELPEIIYQNPLLDLLVRSLFAFGSSLEPSICSDTIKHIMDAITKVFSQCDQLKKTVVDLIHLNQSDSIKLNTYFNGLTMQYEAQTNQFKCTVSYLRFMQKLFKLDYPYLVLSPSQ